MKVRFLIVSFSILISVHVFGQRYIADMENIAIDHGLPDNSVYSFYQDCFGFMWIGTHHGLSRYDGHVFRNFHFEAPEGESSAVVKIVEKNTTSFLVLTANGKLYEMDLQNLVLHDLSIKFANNNNPGRLSDVMVCRDSSIWLFTDLGVFTQRSTHGNEQILYTQVEFRDEDNSLISNVNAIYNDSSDHLWISTSDSLLYHTAKSILNNANTSLKCTKVQSGFKVENFYENQVKHELWIKSIAQGIYVIDGLEKTEGIISDEEDKFSISGDDVTDIIADQDGRIWIATNSSGINILRDEGNGTGLFINNNSVGKLPSYQETWEVFSRLSDTHMRTLYFDRHGLLWIGTQNNGLFKINFQNETFRHYRQDIHMDNALAHRDVSFPKVTKNGDLWIGTWGGGLHYLSPEEALKSNPEYKRFYPISGDETSISFPRVFPVMEDRNENLWLGTNGGGLNYLARDEREKVHPKFIRYQNDTLDSQSISNNIIRSFLEDSQGNIWIGTEDGLNKWTPQNHTFQKFLNGYMIHEIVEDKGGNLWMPTRYSGLLSWNPTLNALTQYPNCTVDRKKYSLKNMRTALIDQNGVVWFGSDLGLFTFNPKNNKFNHFDQSDGIPEDFVESLQFDQNGRLWIGTWNSGLYVYERDINRFTHFKMSKGNMGNSFTEGSSQADDGTLYFGSRNGFYGFHPDNVDLSYQFPKVLITNVQAGETIVSEDQIYHMNKGHQHGMKFNYNEKVLTLGFSSLSYSLDSDIRYSYQLSGVDDNWYTANIGENRVTYSNLQPRMYTFKVRSMNENGLGEITELSFEVTPPWFRTWWSYCLFGALMIFSIVKIRSFRTAKRKAEQERFKEKIEREKEDRLQQIKLEFFTNISHEIKTPLTLIKAPVENILNSGSLSDENRQYAGLIRSNTERLLRLTNQLLDYRKVSLSQMPVRNEKVDLVKSINEVCGLFKELAILNTIRFSFKSEMSKLISSIDKDKLDSIIFNLLTNAFKHTPDQGEIQVSVKLVEADRLLCIEVKDSGAGISEGKLDEVFGLFYSEKSDVNAIQKGTGIGLALVKELVTLMKGDIRVDSQEGSGTTFSAYFKVSLDEVGQQPMDISWNEISEDKAGRNANANEFRDNGLPILLVVEDDREMNNYVSMQFKELYSVMQAYDGAQALDLAIKYNLDLVITDVMMPIMSGIELCDRLKSDLKTSHIPIVMLTAKGQDKDKLVGVEKGADTYLVKPFSAELLKVTVKKLIEGRKLLHEKYSKSVIVEPSGITITSVDEQFIKKVMDTVDHHLDSSEFSVEQMAKEVGASSPQLYRKVKAITGLAPNEFIRDLRLKRAALMLKESGLTVSEISYKVGFGNPKYFSRCFSQQFDASPKAYRNTFGK